MISHNNTVCGLCNSKSAKFWDLDTNTYTHQPTQKIFPYIRSLQILLSLQSFVYILQQPTQKIFPYIRSLQFQVCQVLDTYTNNPHRKFSYTSLISSTILTLQSFGYIYQTNYTDFSPHFSSYTSSGCCNSKSTRLWIQVYRQLPRQKFAHTSKHC
jgi:hypothetical protein